MKDVLINWMEGIFSQCIHLLNHYIVHFKRINPSIF